MGSCAGKNKSKSSEQESDSNKKPKSRKKGSIDHIDFQLVTDDHGQSTSTQENLPLSNDSNTQPMNDQYDGINKAISQIFSSRVILVSDSELEYELVNLIFGHPEYDYAENPPLAKTFKSTEV